MHSHRLTRRRMITIAAAAAGSLLAGRLHAGPASESVRWRGSALGAQVSIEMFHPDRAEAELLIERAITEVRRLEGLFSLYQPSSAICELNLAGLLVAPDPDMVALLRASLRFAELTGGAFDPTVQPLWRLYQEHFAADRADPAGPSAERLAEALTKVGHARLRVSADRIVLRRRGAAITLNGIAQGYATDHVVELFRRAGVTTTLVDMGEIRALGAGPHGTPWQVGIAHPELPGQLSETIPLVDRAVATSAATGFRFDPDGRFTHLFDPLSGRSPLLYRSVSVVAPTATEADALSTAFSLMPAAAIRDVVDSRTGVDVHLVDRNGITSRL
ncbi:FAD:protein FMN transferase [Rhodopseudomonas palustris]|uniref:FAD:protein FMN transferase n=1 Tax=Rhodopseudomonas palustris TaxID=1076 RepID=A0A418VD07_RHOPL|nr:FAD:protein FMN transferase [Rhodopseudomonas palustris]RJF74007.1 FAD:protein FMN transferase [Rhodopseudomonas palustris]